MKAFYVSALALGLAAASAAAPAYAAEPAEAPFRTAAPQAFSAADLQRYGLSAEQASRGAALQEQGYEIRMLSPEEAQAYQAGITDNQWLLLGILAGVVIIAVAVS
jgi:Flp pilus assembly protein TadB